MEVRLLGPVEVFQKGRHIDLGPPQRRTVFAALALDPGRPVSLPALIRKVWDEPPERATDSLYAHLTRLRRALAAIAVPIERRSGGYVLPVDRELVDVHRFDRLAERARCPGLDDVRRVGLLDEAIRLWRGPPLIDLPGCWAAQIRHGLEQRYVSASAAWARAQLRLGRPEAVVTELADVVLRYPLAEPLSELLMRALWALGRTAEALEHYDRLRAQLVEQLGIKPGPELRELHEEMLRGRHDPPSRRIESGHPGPATGAREIPAQLPPVAAGFTGRAAELHLLDYQLARRGAEPSTLSISVITGTAGVGKTTLALHWAHQVAELFPDGQLYVDLRGYDPDRPREPGEALAGFLRALGVVGPDIPVDVQERTARLRSLVAGRRLLLLLDNASSAEQVRPLLPGSPSCMVVVTSRHSLAGLVSREGAQRLELDLLPLADAVALLRRLIGTRVTDEPRAATTLVERCARLPLALRVVGELVVARAAAKLSGLADELDDERRRLDVLDAAGDPRAAVGTVFSWSYAHLAGPIARTFRLLGLHPGDDFDAYGTAALCGAELTRARHALDVLAAQHLIAAVGSGRFRMHDLLRAFAITMAQRHDARADQRSARTRLFDYLLYTAATAMDLVYPAERQRRPRIERPATPYPGWNDRADAAAWLDAERANLLAATEHAAAYGWPRHVTRFAATLFRDLNLRGDPGEALALQERAVQAARGTADSEGEAAALVNLGVAYGMQGRYPDAVAAYQAALHRFTALGDPLGRARVLYNLGLVALRRGQDPEAAAHLAESLSCYREAGDLSGESACLGGIASLTARQERYEESLAYRLRALRIARDIKDSRVEAQQLNQLGVVYAKLHRYEEAAENYQRALRIARDIDDAGRQSESLYGLGTVAAGSGDVRAAAAYQREALELAERSGDAYGRTVVLNGLGEILHALGQSAQARASFAEALSLASQMGNQDELARARDGLAALESLPPRSS